jgi:hypothetical protein
VTALLYVVRPGENEELRHSLRSVAANLPHDEVWIAGSPPEWVKNVGVIATPDHGTKWTRIAAALATACARDDVPDDLVYCNDDQFVMEPMESVPVFHRGPLTEQHGYKSRSSHSGGIHETEALMEQIGLIGPFLSYEPHVPLPVRRELMAESLDTARRRAPKIRCLHYRTLYGNTWAIGGERIQDVKVHGDDPLPEGPLVSTNDSSFRSFKAGRAIRERFPEPGPYEKEM